ncbi:MAG: type IV pili methyl-accepting chemotaxis transducer N-terminal domain-containing protein [Aliishimia sp.]
MSYKKPPLRNLLNVTTLCAATLSVTATTANSTEPTLEDMTFDAGLVQDVGGSERINFSGKLRMLSQRVPAAACNLNAGVDPFHSSETLNASATEFHNILEALEFGDPTMGIIGAERSRKGLMAIKVVKDIWVPVEDASGKLLDDSHAEVAEQYVAHHNLELLEAAKLLVSQLSGQYANPVALLNSDAIRLDIAGRQRMLTQKVSKEACHILSEINGEEAKKALPRTIQMFEISHQALRFGMPEAGIKAIDDSEINAGLDLVASNWAALRPLLATIEAGGELDLSTRAELAQSLNTTMKNMNDVVHLYSDASKLGT